MSGIAIAGNNSGSADVQVQAPAVNTPRQYDLPKHGGKVAAFGAPAAKTATGTAVDFINGSGDVVIPDDARRITVIFNGVSTNGSSPPIIQLGSGSPQTSGYLGSASNIAGAVSTSLFTSGLALAQSVAAGSVIGGIATLVRVSGNSWVASSVMAASDGAATQVSSSRVTLSGALDRIRLTTVNGTDSFDAGSVAILVE